MDPGSRMPSSRASSPSSRSILLKTSRRGADPAPISSSTESRAAGADSSAEPLQMGPQPPHTGEVVLELGELDLELALGAVGVVGEDVEDHGGPIDHRHPEGRLEISLLTGQELVVAGDQVGVV